MLIVDGGLCLHSLWTHLSNKHPTKQCLTCDKNYVFKIIRVIFFNERFSAIRIYIDVSSHDNFKEKLISYEGAISCLSKMQLEYCIYVTGVGNSSKSQSYKDAYIFRVQLWDMDQIAYVIQKSIDPTKTDLLYCSQGQRLCALSTLCAASVSTVCITSSSIILYSHGFS